MAPSTKSAVHTAVPDDVVSDPLLALAARITQSAHLLIPGRTDSQLAQDTRQGVKLAFDRALASEPLSFPHLQTLLESLSPASAPTTRSAAARRVEALDEEPPLKLELTPLETLTTDGLDDEMVWEQMEMRARGVVDVLEGMFGGAGEEEDEDQSDDGEPSDEDDEDDEEQVSSEDEDSDEDAEEDEEEMDYDEDGASFDDFDAVDAELDDAELAAVESDDEEDEDKVADDGALVDTTKDLTLASFDEPASKRIKYSKRSGPVSEIDDAFFSLADFHAQTDEGEFEMARALRNEPTSDDEADGEGGEDGEGPLDLFAPVGGSKGRGNSNGDDDDSENDEDEDEMPGDGLDATGVRYADFFEPPAKMPKKGKGKGKGKDRPGKTDSDLPDESTPGDSIAPAGGSDGADAPVKANGKRGVRFSDAVKVKMIPHRSEINGFHDDDEDDDGMGEMEGLEGEHAGQFAMAGIEDEDDEDEEDGGSDEQDEDEEEDENEDENEDVSEDDSVEDGQETIERAKNSLFDDDDEEDREGGEKAALSRHERRLMALSSQIAALEAENVGTKNWATKGEAKSRDRPVNSLLDEDLEYERMGKVVPVITEESTKTIEDLIKKRILENQFDDVVRRRPIDPHAFLPSRYMDLQDTKSNKSLAEIYEDEYAAARDGDNAAKPEVDSELEKRHEEIEALFEDLSSKLDALSNARFTPKPPKATISTITNLPSVSLESALPTATSASTMLAPEEVYVPDPRNEDRSEFTPAQKRAARQKRRKQRAAMAEKADKFAHAKGIKGDKERAQQALIGTKGVTVLGKGGRELKAEKGKGTKRKRGDEDGSSGVALKL